MKNGPATQPKGSPWKAPPAPAAGPALKKSPDPFMLAKQLYWIVPMSIMIGEPSIFAVEYELESKALTNTQKSTRRIGGLRLWFNNLYLGYIKDYSILGGAIYNLVFLRDRPKGASTIYVDESKVPDFWDMVNADDWSLNESFDDFTMIYYCTENTAEVHFRWLLSDTPHFVYENYPKGIHHARVPYKTYDYVINELLKAIYPDGYEEQKYDDLPPGLTPLI